MIRRQNRPKRKPKPRPKLRLRPARKRIIKRILFIVIPLLIIAVIALLVYLFFIKLPSPAIPVQNAINAAFMEDEEAFKENFTPESIAALESAWSGADFGVGATRGSWAKMMRGILTKDELKPKVVSEKIAEDGQSAEVILDIDGVERTINLVMIDDRWLIDVNQGIDPNIVVLAGEDIPEEVAQEMATSDPENELWWEEREAAGAEAEKKGGCLGCSLTSDSQAPPAAAWLLLLGVGLLLRPRRNKNNPSSRNSTSA